MVKGWRADPPWETCVSEGGLPLFRNCRADLEPERFTIGFIYNPVMLAASRIPPHSWDFLT